MAIIELVRKPWQYCDFRIGLEEVKKIKEKALEDFCGTILSDVAEGINSSTNPTNHGKYLFLYKLIENSDKQIALLFNDHSRSKATIQLMMLRGEGLVKESDIQDLSAEFREQTKPGKYI